MPQLEIGKRVRVVSSVPGFYLRRGAIMSIGHSPLVREGHMEDALRELRLYDVRFDNGRRFRFRGKDLVLCEK